MSDTRVPSRPVRAAALVLLIAGVLAGCVRVTDGTAVTAPPTVAERAIPDTADLEDILGAPLRVGVPMQVGGIEVLRTNTRSSLPQCSAVSHGGALRAYRGAPVELVVSQLWDTMSGGSDGAPVAVSIAVIEMDTVADAEEWYEEAAAQWQRCRGRAVIEQLPGLTFVSTVTEVEDTAGLLTAVVAAAEVGNRSAPILGHRAVTVAERYIVDVESAGTAGNRASPGGAADVARLVAGRIEQR